MRANEFGACSATGSERARPERRVRSKSTSDRTKNDDVKSIERAKSGLKSSLQGRPVKNERETELRSKAKAPACK